ncbi:glutathione hydrolase 1 proenzyme-like isoform X2 [Anneissia japonica]|uniref:glutathione hydrolase 1 proenzyme-like isoform X2 n=1 Tax=Anneissia japonica TaxID=1529436 RepID=UPI0014257028|nr:glutathione hydrolase 1 proenzyme-like isoform X2 [Anneissia japonica]
MAKVSDVEFSDTNRTKVNPWRVVFIILLCLGLIAGVLIGTIIGREWESYEYKHAAVASDNADCSRIGKEILKKGGNAVDGAVASMLCVGLHNAHSTGIGGGSFMVIRDSEEKGQIFAYDFREEAPGLANETMFVNDTTDASVLGGLAIGVPGEVKGYWTVHQKHGRLPWSDLFTPSIELARNGFIVTDALAKAILSKKEIIEEDPSLSEVFVGPDGGILKEGDTMFRLKLARTYERIAEGGEKEFYEGELSKDILKDIQDRDGIIKAEDLKNYAVKERNTTFITITAGEKTLQMFSLPPPASGAVLSLILNILDEYNFNVKSYEEDTVQTYHRIVEAFKFAYAKRSALGDQDYVDVEELVKNMTSDEYAKELQEMITNNTHNTSYYGPLFGNEEDYGTAHLSIVDENGMAVSMTSTINTYFGSKVRGTRTGIIFNNEMDDFSTPGTVNSFGVPASPSNFIKPGKRPMSSMCPSIFLDKSSNKAYLVVGASGGTRITTGTALASMNTLWFGLNIEHAIKKLRIHHQLVPTYITYEKDFSKEILDGLEKRKHETKQTSSKSVVQGIKRKSNDYLTAYCDDRKGGKPAGY